jgi:hypothetical protein
VENLNTYDAQYPSVVGSLRAHAAASFTASVKQWPATAVRTRSSVANSPAAGVAANVAQGLVSVAPMFDIRPLGITPTADRSDMTASRPPRGAPC